MPRAKKSSPSTSTNSEQAVSKSPAEFFAENQSIAGFDNPGKSLYTTVRELVENALDACESSRTLPDISLVVEEMSQGQFNVLRMAVHGCSTTTKGKGTKKGSVGDADGYEEVFSGVDWFHDANANANANDSGGKGKKKTDKNADVDPPTDGSNTKPTKKKTGASQNREARYYRVTVRDNGCGMDHNAVPQLLGRVLSSSKYGVRQTRGKFGLGAKMALIWGKKSTGVPIRVRTMQESSDAGMVSTCVLDIDIYKNEPRVLLHEQSPDDGEEQEGFGVGTEIAVIIGGNWTTYKSRIVQYLHQLAIITPYARLTMKYVDLSSSSNKGGGSSKDMSIRYDRRSDQMPEPAREVKHHPSSVNNLLVLRLLEHTKCKTLEKFLVKELSGVTPTLAKKFLGGAGGLSAIKLTGGTHPSSINEAQVTRLVQALHATNVFRSPDSSCLSPLGEYNLNLGIRKVIEPDLVATARDKPGAYEGHPFLVEAAVSLGGKDSKEGITVVRFANRIPLLFEAGADVVTRVTQNKIKWSSYKIDHKRDKIGVFVSIVSTKVPFKGTGKEYIGDDITEIQQSVKRALQTCCQQLRTHLTKRNALRDIKERQSRLVKYVPDVSRAIFGLLSTMQKRRLDDESDEGDGDDGPPTKKSRLDRRALQSPQKTISVDDDDGGDEEESSSAREEVIIQKLQDGDITEETIKESLMGAITSQQSSINAKAASSPRRRRLLGLKARPLFFVPIFDELRDVAPIEHPAFSFRPMKHVEVSLLGGAATGTGDDGR